MRDLRTKQIPCVYRSCQHRGIRFSDSVCKSCMTDWTTTTFWPQWEIDVKCRTQGRKTETQWGVVLLLLFERAVVILLLVFVVENNYSCWTYIVTTIAAEVIDRSKAKYGARKIFKLIDLLWVYLSLTEFHANLIQGFHSTCKTLIVIHCSRKMTE